MQRAGVVGRDCVRLQSKWLENNRAACPVGTAGRKRAPGARGWSEGKAESEKAEEKKRRNKTIAKERATEKNEEASEERKRARESDVLYDRENRSHPPMAENREEARDARGRKRKIEIERERERIERERGEEVGIIDADMCSSLGGSNP